MSVTTSEGLPGEGGGGRVPLFPAIFLEKLDVIRGNIKGKVQLK